MAKHDQRIMKFLTQNAERAPTITDMMTRLNISISDITDSLNSLMAQGQVAKRTNGQGIECWFPTNGSIPPEPGLPSRSAPEPRVASPFAGLGLGSSEPSPLPPLHNPTPASALTASAAFPAAPPPPSGRGPAMESAVFTASPSAERSAPSPFSGASSLSAANGASPGESASGPIEHLPGVTPPMPAYAFAQPKSGPGWFSFLVGLLATGAAAVFAGKHLIAKDMAKAQKGFVERSEMDAAVTSWNEFETGTRSQVKALDAEVKALTQQLAAMKTANDSLQAVAAKQAEEAKKAAAVAAKKPAARKRR